MKILHVISTIHPVQGGPIDGSMQLARANFLQGVDSEFALTDEAEALWFKDIPFKIHAAGKSYIKHGLNPSLLSWIKTVSSRFDLVVINGILQYHSYATY